MISDRDCFDSIHSGSYSSRFYPESRFGGFSDIDGTIAFYTRVNSLLASDSVVLDVGCGRGEYADDPILFRRNLRVLKGKAKKVIGLDVDPTASQNCFVDDFRKLTFGAPWPIESGACSLVLCDHVVEHLANPDSFFGECSRVLRNEGYICIRTTNTRSYAALAARLVPNRYHARVLTFAQGNRRPEDVFPTVYRCNSLRKLRRMLTRHGFDHAVYGQEAEPDYLKFSALAYRLGVLHQRWAPRSLHRTIFAFGQLRDEGLQGVAEARIPGHAANMHVRRLRVGITMSQS